MKRAVSAYFSEDAYSKAANPKELFEIKIDHVYPDEYKPMTEQAKVDIAEGFRPKITSSVDVLKYDVVFIGSPNWWGTIAPAVSTFIESGD